MAGRPALVWEPRRRAVRYRIPAPFRRNWSRFFSWLLDRSQLEFDGGATVHASAVLLGRRAVVFCGRSGAGKSTLYGWAEARERLADEFVDITPAEGGGWRGGAPGAPGHRLEAVLFPRHGARLGLRRLPPERTLRLICPQVFVGLWFAARSRALIDFALRLARHVPCYALTFPKRAHTLEWVRRELAHVAAQTSAGSR